MIKNQTIPHKHFKHNFVVTKHITHPLKWQSQIASLVTNQICRTLAPSRYTNIYHIIEKNCTRALLEMISKIVIVQTIMFRSGTISNTDWLQ